MLGWKADFFGVPPQFFEGIMFTDVFQKNVDDHVAKIHENPFCRAGAFNAERPMALSGQNSVDVVRNCSSLALRVPGT